ncbi:MAG: discoidin domain-containing protein, partial [Clostridia bacterium]|nr:discoidin domain-containing protein [Clostridia bacterium]
ASSTENDNIPENILDGNSKTRWVASSSSYPQSITADLGKEYTLDTISIDWFSKKNRSYT